MFRFPPGSTLAAVILAVGFALPAFAGGDAARGATLSAVCAACHGADGNSIAGAFPSIAGQSAKYMAKQVRDMQTGARDPGVMAGMIDALTPQDLADIGAHYAAQTAKGGAANPDLVGLGERIYLSGIGRKSVAACSACHSPSGGGNDAAGFPALKGQWPEYTVAQLNAFRAKKRTNDGDSSMMRDVTRDLNDDEIVALADYLYGLR